VEEVSKAAQRLPANIELATTPSQDLGRIKADPDRSSRYSSTAVTEIEAARVVL